MKKDLISIKDLTRKDLADIFSLTDALKKKPDRFSNALRGKILTLIFQKPSCRTRVSFEVGMYQLGGNSLYLGPDQIKLGLRESTGDISRTLSRYVDGIALRTFAHKNILQMAEYASIPVINALTDLLHPCQALADIYTMREKFSDLKKITLAFIGDGNNVCHSLLYGCSKVGFNLNIATPKGYSPKDTIIRQAKSFAKISGAKINIFNQAEQAARGADVIYTDVWASMGQENESKVRINRFRQFQVNQKLVSLAKSKCLIMHCLPAHRGEEITDEVIDCSNSIVFDQTENRLHVQKAILILLLGAD
ncbi:MAG: ornithine carbamoyltransferase [Candidatus Omnitrophota bacterium]|jgi:ornithine carbamoyltransferase